MRKVDETGAMMIHSFIFEDKFVQFNCLVSHILRALLVRFQAESVPTFSHVNRTETEAKNIKLTGLARTLTIALSID